MLKLIVHHAPKLLVFVCGLHLHLSKPQWQHVIRLADALIVSDTRHKTIAGVYRLIVDAPDASNGADSLRISPWTADDLRAPLRLFTVTDLVAYANETNEWTLYVSLDDSLGEKDGSGRAGPCSIAGAEGGWLLHTALPMTRSANLSTLRGMGKLLRLFKI